MKWLSIVALLALPLLNGCQGLPLEADMTPVVPFERWTQSRMYKPAVDQSSIPIETDPERSDHPAQR